MKAKRVAISIGIALLMPCVVHTAAAILSPPPDGYARRTAGSALVLAVDLPAPTNVIVSARQTAPVPRPMSDDDPWAPYRRYFWTVFALAYPIGVSSMIVGAVIRNGAVGGGLMFGGLFTLVDGLMYSSVLPPWLRLTSLLGALVMLVGLGTWKLGNGEPSAHEPPAADAE